MLNRVSLLSLQKAAIYGAVLSAIGSSVFYYLTQRNICSGPYFTEAVAALKRNENVCNFLGKPVRIKALKLGDRNNWVTTEQAQVLIPVAGSRTSGILKSNATVRNGKWELDSVVLQFDHRPEIVEIINTHKK